MRISAIILLCSSHATWAFTPSSTQNKCIQSGSRQSVVGGNALFLSAEATVADDETTTTSNDNDSLQIPLTYNEMVQQVSQTMSEAYQLGISRQIVRILLPRDASSGQLGEYFEAEAEIADRTKSQEMKLVPCDESWQGGIMQLYRAASPTTMDIMRQCSPTTASTGVPPKIIEDRSIDESGVDGVGLLYTQIGSCDDESASVEDTNENGFGGFFGESITLPTLSENDSCFFLQPSQEVVDIIEDLSSKSGSSLIALLNPQWRNVDDALDSASKSDGVFGAFASFLGGKGSVLKRLDELDYRPTYTLEGYVCKGGNVRLLKRFDSEWIVFAENDNGDDFIKLGSMGDRPSYQDVEKMLDDKGVGYKYARDLGMAPKL